jgi:hypothetical protein
MMPSPQLSNGLAIDKVGLRRRRHVRITRFIWLRKPATLGGIVNFWIRTLIS